MRWLLYCGLIAMPFSLVAQEYNAEILKHKTSIRIRNGKAVKECHREIMINNRSGEEYTKVTIPFSNISKVRKIKAYIKDHNGKTVRKLKKRNISERSSISDYTFYEDDYVKEFTLKHNTYPYTIVYSFQRIEKEFLYVDYWIPVIDHKIPTRHASLKVTVPHDYQISYTSDHIQSFLTDTTEYLINYKWEARYAKVFDHEVLAPSLHEFMPSVAVVPKRFSYEQQGSTESWIDFGNWQYRLLQGLNDLPNHEKSKVNDIIKNADNKIEKIKQLYHYLQDETRYINISIETGGLKPHPASFVATKKYGDCKALTNYFKSVLEYVGIQSYYTKVHAGNPIDKVDISLPSQQFNHIILCIPHKGDTLWLDCTSDAAFGYLGTFTQNRNALVIDQDNSHFVKTPSLTPSDVLEKRKIHITLNSQHGSTTKFQNVYRGKWYELLLRLDMKYNEHEKSKIIQKHFLENGYELIDYHIHPSNRDTTSVQISYEASSGDIFTHYDNTIIAKNISFSLPSFETPSNRQLPVQIDYPVYKVDTLIYEIPDGFEWYNTIDDQHIQNDIGSYKLEIIPKINTVFVIKSLMIHSGYHSVAQYDHFHSFINKIENIEDQINIIFKK